MLIDYIINRSDCIPWSYKSPNLNFLKSEVVIQLSQRCCSLVTAKSTIWQEIWIVLGDKFLKLTITYGQAHSVWDPLCHMSDYMFGGSQNCGTIALYWTLTFGRFSYLLFSSIATELDLDNGKQTECIVCNRDGGHNRRVENQVQHWHGHWRDSEYNKCMYGSHIAFIFMMANN